MTKAELISAIAVEMESSNNKSTKATIRAFLKALEAVSCKSLKKDGAVTIPGLVKLLVLKVGSKPERKARNPATGKEMIVPAKGPGKKLKARFVRSLKVGVGQIAAPPKKASTAKPAAAKPAKAKPAAAAAISN
jgi:nucleoid DNA-binding protein